MSTLPVPIIAYAEPVAAAEAATTAKMASAPPPPSPPSPVQLDEAAARAFLGEHGFPVGLQTAFIAGLARTPVRFFLLDDSGSMASNDGMRLVVDNAAAAAAAGAPPPTTWVTCSRWTELADATRFHVQLAHAARAPTWFRFLNSLPPVLIGGNEDDAADTARLLRILDGPPSAGTPLCSHIRDVVAQIRCLAPALRAAGQKAALVIATDGEPTDGDVCQALAPLRDLPVTLTLRMCTDDSRVVGFWNQVDADLEMELDVLDDFRSEAMEVSKHNPWLTYGRPLHWLRESGLGIRVLDALDERALPPDDLRHVVQMIYFDAAAAAAASPSSSSPPLMLPEHPQMDPAAFKRAVAAAAAAVPPVWDPVEEVTRPWINVHGGLDVALAAAAKSTTKRAARRRRGSSGRCCCCCCIC